MTIMDDLTLDKLLDERRIEQVLIRYALALDEKDWAGLDDVFVADTTAHYEGIGDFDSRDGIRDMVRGAIEGFRLTQHLLGNFRIAVDGDKAAAKCYLQAIHLRPESAAAMLTVWGEYSDRLERRPEGWRIVHRDLAIFHVAGDLGGTPLAKN
jgi:3-phenylpropionate/cinnamic acid dioxygenase small subunit